MGDLDDECDEVVAATDLARRSGATAVEWGHLDRPGTWYVSVRYRGSRETVEGHVSPQEAATALAARILNGGGCKCGRPSTTDDTRQGCRWRLVGRRWEPGCTAPPLELPAGTPGTIQAIQQEWSRRFTEPGGRRG